jgi:hypothetical protein
MSTNLTESRTYMIAILVALSGLLTASAVQAQHREYNDLYEGPHLNRVVFPIGGFGAGMIRLEGTGAMSHVSVRNTM